ncbi:MAG: acetyl-CoA acetyltransferase, partial [Frankiales bacterium]|nr:acetyl-CoA acetyltransferase [Frankiales bacterium]
MADDLHRPVIVGVGQLHSNRDRTVAGAREPLHLITEALRAAAPPALLAAADAVHAVHVASWAYGGLARRVAGEVGASPSHLEDTGLGGHLPVRLLERAAARIAAGGCRVALVVGGEAQASVSLLGKAGVDPVAQLGWTADPGGPPAFDLDQLGSPAMQAAGMIAPTRVYPLYENRLQADLGLTPELAHAWSSRLYAALTGVASAHPAAWEPDVLTPDEVGTAGPANRMVCEPYPLRMNAMPHVDQAAAVVVTSLAAARAHGVPDADLVHVWGGAGSDDDPDVLVRPDLGGSRALGDALDRCLTRAGLTVADLDLLDVYSCFPVVPKLVGRHLGLAPDAVLSVTGGHSAFGGPLNSYALHAVATMVQRLRAGGGTGLVHGNGGYLTYQHAVVLSSGPHPAGYVGDPVARTVTGPAVEVVALGEEPVDVVVETATVEHDRSGAPAQAFVVGRTPGGARAATCTRPGDAA